MTFIRHIRSDGDIPAAVAVALGAVALAAAIATGRIPDILTNMWAAGSRILTTMWTLAHGLTAGLVDVAGLPTLLGTAAFTVVTLATVGGAPRNR